MVLFVCMHLIVFYYLMIAIHFCLEGNSFIFLALFDGILVLLMIIILGANVIFVCQEENDHKLTYVQLFFYSSSSTLISVGSKKFRKLFDSFLGAFLQAATNNIYKHEFSCSFVCQERYRVNVVSPFVIGR